MWTVNASSQTRVTEKPEKICESKTVINPYLFHRDGSSSCKSILISSNTFCALSSSSSAYKHIKLHQSMTWSSIILFTHKALAVEIDWPEYRSTLFDLSFIWPKCAWNFILFELYLTKREEDSYLCWPGKMILSSWMRERESKYWLALFTAQNVVALVIVSHLTPGEAGLSHVMGGQDPLSPTRGGPLQQGSRLYTKQVRTIKNKCLGFFFLKHSWKTKDYTLVILIPSFPFLPLFTAAKLCRALSKSTSFLSRFAIRA